MEEEINLLDYMKVIWKCRKFIVSFTCLLLIFTVIICVLMPWTYTAETTIIIPQQRRGFESVTTLLSEMSMNVPLDIYQSTFGRTKNYSDILKSYSLANKVVDGLSLYKEYPKIKDKDKLIKMIRKSIKIKEGKGIIKLFVSSRSPKLAASVANYYILALDDFNKSGNLQISKRISEFLREKIGEAKVDLALAEEKLKKFETESHLVKISERELKLARLMRDVKVKQALYTMLLQEYEKSKIEEAKEELFFEVLDAARPPKHPSSPRMRLYPALAMVLGLFMGGFLSFFFEYLEGLGVRISLPDFDRKVDFEFWRKS